MTGKPSDIFARQVLDPLSGTGLALSFRRPHGSVRQRMGGLDAEGEEGVRFSYGG